MTLDGLERFLQERLPKRWEGRRIKVNLVRFADDFIITGQSQVFLLMVVKPLVEEFFQERGLELSQEKTIVTHIQDGFNFLGQNVRKYGNKLLIKPAEKSIRKLMEKVSRIVKSHPQAKAENLIRLLNPIIRGWVQYHRHVVSKAIFSALDHNIFEILWQWARRRHPHKNAQWIRRKYFCSIQGKNWVFFGNATGKTGKPRKALLFSAAQTPIQRHIKIRGQANPYDPAWEVYLEQRLGTKMNATLAGKRKLLYLWKKQNGLCPVCNQKITPQSGWHNHHLVERSKGGSNKAENRVLLHPNCHRQVHNPSFSVGKLRLGSQGV
jgi:RNA-directed DNA polymerase